MRAVLRSFVRRPLVPAFVIATMGIAIASNTALFSVVDGLLFRPLPYHDADRLVHLELDRAVRGARTPREIQDLTERTAGTPSLVARGDARPALLFDPVSAATLDWQIRPASVSVSVFRLLGVRPFAGRVFTDADTVAPPHTVLLGYDLWRSRFGGDLAIIGQRVEIPGAPPGTRWHIAGVMPEDFSFPDGANFWIPAYDSYPRPPIVPYGRLARGVTVEALRSELPGVVVTPLRDHVRPGAAVALAWLLAASTLMFLVALVQVAALLLAQVTSRVHEIGIHLALGASRWQLARQAAVEAATLVALALVVASVVAQPLTVTIIGMLPSEVTLGQHLDLDRRAFTAAAIGAAIATAVLALLPLGAVRGTSAAGMIQGGRIGSVQLHTARSRSVLFATQLAVVTVLVYLTALTFHSFVRLGRTDVGFGASDLVTIRMPRGDGLTGVAGKSRLAHQRDLVADTVRALEALDGVMAVSGSHSAPFQRGGLRTDSFHLPTQPSPVQAKYSVITRKFAETLGLRLLAGAEPEEAQLRAIGARMPPGEQLALANEALARQLERSGPSIGQLLSGRFRIVGIIPDVKLDEPDRPVAPTLFHYLPPPAAPAVLLVRLSPGRTAADSGLPEVLSRLWGESAPAIVEVPAALAAATSEHRARTMLLAMIAMLTLPLAIVGIAGALSYGVKQRSKEIAIRMALGARRQDIQRQVVGAAVATSGGALAVGLLLGVGAGRIMRATLFGVQPADPLAIGASIVIVLGVATATALFPARRAGRVDPIEALRHS